MTFADTWQSILHDFVLCVERGNIPPLSTYLSDYVASGSAEAAGDYRLVPLTPPAVRFANTSSDCSTDCMLELQAKYQQIVPDDFGGHLEKGNRDIAVIGFNVLDGPVLDIVEINKTTSYVEWSEAKLEPLDWQQLLVHAVVDFGRFCGAKQVRLPKEHDRCARAGGFVLDEGRGCFVRDLPAR
jgi:hypothetical protein